MDNTLTHLRQLLVQHFNLDELKTLCFDLGINYDELAGETLSGKARELILKLGRQRELEQLLDILRQTRPEMLDQEGFASDAAALEALYAELHALPPEPTPREGEAHPITRARALKVVPLNWILGAGLVAVILLGVGFLLFGRGGDDRSALPTDTSEPAVAATSQPTNTPEPEPPPGTTEPIEGERAIQTVRVEDPRSAGPTRGFFTPNGYIIAFVLSGSTDVTVVWNGQEWPAQVVDRGGLIPEEVALLQLVDTDPPPVQLSIRLSSSLRPGDIVESYISPQDRTPGTVLEVNAQRDIGFADGTVTLARALITTRISTYSDAGAPVLDSDGRVVGMVFGGSQNDTISVSIDYIKSSFIQAFP